jgi:hypothetical protein
MVDIRSLLTKGVDIRSLLTKGAIFMDKKVACNYTYEISPQETRKPPICGWFLSIVTTNNLPWIHDSC